MMYKHTKIAMMMVSCVACLVNNNIYLQCTILITDQSLASIMIDQSLAMIIDQSIYM